MPTLKHTLTLLMLLAFLCGCGPKEQSPFSNDELDRFIATNAEIMKVVRQTHLASAGRTRNIEKAIVKAKKTKILELGWDLDRYNYVYEHCRLVLSREDVKESIEAYGKKTDDPLMGPAATQIIAKSSAALKRLDKIIEESVPASEQQLILEKSDALIRNFDPPVRTFKPAA